jgi:2,3-bisphosphoglycerate-independent phosphoglycerate mutase
LSDELRRVLEAQPANAQRAAQGLPPANVVLLRGCGCRIAVPSFKQLHGMRAAIVAPTKIIAGG